MSLAVWLPSPFDVVRKMLEMAEVSSEDVVYDLGCGDARILIMAVNEFGAKRAVGYEISQDLYKTAQQEIQHQNLQDQITLIRGDLLDADLSEASVITLYLSDRANEVLRPKLEKEAKPGTRIVSYFFPIATWQPASEVNLADLSVDAVVYLKETLYLYLIPQAFQGSNND